MRWLSGLLAIFVCLVAIALPVVPAQAVDGGPSLTLYPTSGVPGTNVTVRGYNFTVDKWVDISYDGTYIHIYVDGTYRDDVETDEDGDFIVTLTIPESYTGAHTVLARDQEYKSASANFTVKPGLTVSPEEGPVGTNVTVEGHGFAKNEGSIELAYYLDGSYETKAQNISANANGWWEKSFVIPPSAKGIHKIDARGATSTFSQVGDATFEVMPRITLDKSSGTVGENITMTGSGFYADERYITILFAGEEVGTEIRVDADDEGYWVKAFEVPEMPIGTYNVTAYGESTRQRDVPMLSFEIEPGLVLSPDEGYVGMDLAITGSGFAISEDVVILYEGIQRATTMTNATGSFVTIFPVPESQHGEHQVTAEDAAGNNATAIFTMESTPPDTPGLKSPSDGSRVGFVGKIRPTFNWSAVYDPSGVYYNLQIAASDNVTASGGFADPLLSIPNIVATNYTLNATQALSYGTYYWVVQAVDRAGNAGNWTTLHSFHTGALPLWAFILAIIVFVAVVGTLVYYFVIRKRMHYYY